MNVLAITLYKCQCVATTIHKNVVINEVQRWPTVTKRPPNGEMILFKPTGYALINSYFSCSSPNPSIFFARVGCYGNWANFFGPLSTRLEIPGLKVTVGEFNPCTSNPLLTQVHLQLVSSPDPTLRTRLTCSINIDLALNWLLYINGTSDWKRGRI